jgi:hypothetical protein
MSNRRGAGKNGPIYTEPPGPSADDHRDRRSLPYRLITTDDPCKTLAQGEVRYFATLIDAANAFAKTPEPYKQIVYDDGCTARELNADEQRLLENVCAMLGYDVEEVGA